MSFTDYVSTTWDFLFAKNHRTPDTELPIKPVDLSHFNNPGKEGRPFYLDICTQIDKWNGRP